MQEKFPLAELTVLWSHLTVLYRQSVLQEYRMKCATAKLVAERRIDHPRIVLLLGLGNVMLGGNQRIKHIC